MKIDSSAIQMTAQAAQANSLKQQQNASLVVSDNIPISSGLVAISEHEATYQYHAEDRLYLYSSGHVSQNGEVSKAFNNNHLLTEVIDVALSGKDATHALTVKNGQPVGSGIPGFSGSAQIELSRYQFISES